MAPKAALLGLTAALVLMLVHRESSAVAAAAVNVTEILERGGQYSTFILYLGKTQAGVRIENDLNNTNNKITLFAPTDNAFRKLPAGAFNNLSPQHQSELLLFHGISNQYLTWENFKAVSNPVMTMAGGGYTINITSGDGHQVNISTGFVTVPINNELNLTSPNLAVYTIETVLQPPQLFGAPPSTPSPGVAATNGTATAAAPPSQPAAPTTKQPPSPPPGSKNSALRSSVAGWSVLAVAGMVGSLMAIV